MSKRVNMLTETACKVSTFEGIPCRLEMNTRHVLDCDSKYSRWPQQNNRRYSAKLSLVARNSRKINNQPFGSLPRIHSERVELFNP